MPTPSAYPWLFLSGIVLSFLFWARLARRDERLLAIYFSALAGAFIGSKLAYFVSEGWLHWDSPQRWLILAAGKSITGALPGGYLGVELAKRTLGWREPTGDFFALVAPFGIMIGRVGCLLHGCCLGETCAPHPWAMRDAEGVPRWPAVPVEMAFNALMLSLFLFLRRGGRVRLPCQHFHLYLMAYGTFRFAHEFFRATPRLIAGLSGYALIAIGIFALGAIGFTRRARLLRAGLPASLAGYEPA